MKVTIMAVTVLASIVFTGMVNAQQSNNKELVKDKETVKQMINESFVNEANVFIDSDLNQTLDIVVNKPEFKAPRRLLSRNETLAPSKVKTQAED
ncbi:hypothetical protein ISG33_06240 [Glaciecola sp. MH2013]|uniref:hypothetical protein n=1 Tax=Glaciecola sp. MH2013 TaxID=2785524 RepID=UPI00189F4F32|nr:hypothetical protein [Glaciecola sp. MH2013]MBF7072996.1 hypothetical protein [Glaciecola sp. MH2013]